ncbi:hypothetical protein pb186bvf_013353 [Paramecium bursaria]
MKLLTDAFSDAEIVSDSFGIVELFDGFAGEIDSKLLVKNAVQVDVGAGGEFGGKDEDDEGVDDQAVKVNNVLDAFHYAETQFAKADYVNYFKSYIKKVKAYLEEKKPQRVAAYQAGAQQFIKWVLSKFDDFQFYCPENYDMENHIILAYYKEGNEAPTFIYLLDGLKEVKL